MADLRVRQGRFEEAASLLLGHEDQSGAQLAAAALRLARGDAAGAVILLQRRLAQTATGHIGSAPALALLVRASLLLGEVDAARQAAGTLAMLANDQRSAYTEALAAVSAGHVSVALDDIDGGRERLETALSLFVKLDMPHDAARARLDLARVLAARQPHVATGEAEAALATFDQIGAVSDADAAAALLRSLGVAPRSARRRGGELTERERQVLNLIGLGLAIQRSRLVCTSAVRPLRTMSATS